ncbi:MAG: phosphomannomutase [Parcubacteria bacterium C7867-005]|nr:MAG: phosphomannomutase [Parcubacteria bacterium C7867-005]
MDKINPQNFKVVVFDLDGTLAVSKQAIDKEMEKLIEDLLEKKKVAIISGGRWRQFKEQLLNHLNLSSHNLSNLFIAPGGGTSMYRFIEGEIHEMYADLLTKEEKEKVFSAFEYALDKAEFIKPERLYGDMLEDRQSEITFSALGQKAPIEEKSKWDPDHKKRLEIMKFLSEKIPEFEIHAGGTTSIDVVKKGEDKAYGIRQISERLGIPISEMVYVGDALYEGGNDEAAKKTGILCVPVVDPEETKSIIRSLLE